MGRRGGSDRQFWLQAWDGDPYPVDRVGRPSFTLPHLLIGIVGGMQPDRLAEAFKGAADGMYTRFLFNWPAELSYEKMPRFYNERDSDISKMLERIVALPSTNSKDSRIKLTPEAVDTFEDLRRYVIKKRSALDGREHEWWAKVPAHVLRLAGTLRYMRWGIEGGKEPDAIHSKCVKTADDLIVGYFWPHARAALRLIGLSQRHGDARRVLKWLAGTGKRDITRETVRRDALSQRLDVNETQALLDQLEKAGWLRKAGSEGKGRGRPAIKYTINPQLFK
jgi:hypothetical protein